MLEWSVATLRSVPGIEQIVVALPADALEAAPVGTVAVAGGAVRSESVRAALLACGGGDPVVVHDAARPLAPAALFSDALGLLESSSGVDAVIAAAPVSDTIKQVGADGRTVERTLERARLWAVQTPQVFRRATLERVFRDASDQLLAEATDDAWLVERAGGTVQVVESGARNIKVTTPTDLKLAELLLAELSLAEGGGMRAEGGG
jgi:2-C-methyl-D-erythritol 4-phosphate cytidylyltransferase